MVFRIYVLVFGFISVQIQKAARSRGNSRKLFPGWKIDDVVGGECGYRRGEGRLIDDVVVGE